MFAGVVAKAWEKGHILGERVGLGELRCRTLVQVLPDESRCIAGAGAADAAHG